MHPYRDAPKRKFQSCECRWLTYRCCDKHPGVRYWKCCWCRSDNSAEHTFCRECGHGRNLTGSEKETRP